MRVCARVTSVTLGLFAALVARARFIYSHKLSMCTSESTSSDCDHNQRNPPVDLLLPPREPCCVARFARGPERAASIADVSLHDAHRAWREIWPKSAGETGLAKDAMLPFVWQGFSYRCVAPRAAWRACFAKQLGFVCTRVFVSSSCSAEVTRNVIIITIVSKAQSNSTTNDTRDTHSVATTTDERHGAGRLNRSVLDKPQQEEVSEMHRHQNQCERNEPEPGSRSSTIPGASHEERHAVGFSYRCVAPRAAWRACFAKQLGFVCTRVFVSSSRVGGRGCDSVFAGR